jgi:Protein of unknown function (DUF2510)
MQAIPAGWYVDPWDGRQLRWWDGAQWTPHVTAARAPQPEAQFQRQPQLQPQFRPAPETARRSRPRWFIPVLAGSLSVVLILIIGTAAFVVVGWAAHAGPGVGTAVGNVPSEARLSQLVMTTSDAPAGMWAANGPASTPQVAGQTFSSEKQNDIVIPTTCLPLMLAEPLEASDANSTDPVLPLGTFAAGSTNSSNSDAAVSATARAFSSVAAATAFESAVNSTVTRCQSGYSSTDFSASHVIGLSASVPDGTGHGWSEIDSLLPSTDQNKYLVADFQRGNIVVRATCVVPEKSTLTTSFCISWWESVTHKLSALPDS